MQLKDTKNSGRGADKTFGRFQQVRQKWSIAIRIMPLVFILAGFKVVSHYYGWEIIELNALFTSLVAGTIFIIGFLISGVLADYKESEKLPSELAASMRVLFDDAFTIYKGKDSQAAHQFMNLQLSLVDTLMDWLYKREKLAVLQGKINKMNDFFIQLDKEGIQAGYILKLKNEQSNLRKMILRIDTIRETEFVTSGYAIVEAMGFLIAASLVFIKIEPFYASVFLTLIVTFLIMYMFLLVKDLDNPFDYSVNGETGTEVSLKPIHDLKAEFDSYQIK